VVPDPENAAALPASARARLNAFGSALERLNVGDLTLYAVNPVQPDHDRAVEAAAAIARDLGFEAAIETARRDVVEFVERAYQNAMMRISYMGTAPGTGFGAADDRVRVMRSLSDAVTAVVLGDALDEADRGTLLGPWDELLA